MITRVAIRGYKSLSDVDLDLSALTLVIGPNASGKSNLLDALGLLSRMVSGGTIRSAFDDHRGNPLEAFFVPPGGLEELLAKDVLTFSLGVEVELSDATVGAVERLIRDMREGLPSSSRAEGGIEYAEDIVEEMDIYRACSNVPSLDTFGRDLKKALVGYVDATCKETMN
jgi:energy-coupling factor transporter ATP-binding protein EcfA2